MTYDLHITRAAEHNINGAADHIEFVLFNPQAADSLLEEIEEIIEALPAFPKKHPIVDDPVLKVWEIRCMSVRNYLIFYVASNELQKIYVVRFLFARRDWLSILKQGISFD